MQNRSRTAHLNPLTQGAPPRVSLFEIFAIPVKDFKDSAACFSPKGAGGEPKRRSSSVVHARNARLRSEE